MQSNHSEGTVGWPTGTTSLHNWEECTRVYQSKCVALRIQFKSIALSRSVLCVIIGLHFAPEEALRITRQRFDKGENSHRKDP